MLRARVALIILTALAFAAPAAAGAAEFAPPIRTDGVRWEAVDLDATGSAGALGSATDGRRLVARKPAGGAFQAPLEVRGAAVVLARGEAVDVVTGGDRVEIWRLGGGAPAPVAGVAASPRAGTLRAAELAGGSVVVTWVDAGGVLRGLLLGRDGQAVETGALSGAEERVGDTAIAVTPDGGAVVFYGAQERVAVVRMAPDGAFGTPRTVAGAGPASVAAGVARSGEAQLLWARTAGEELVVEAAVLPAGSPDPGSPVTLEQGPRRSGAAGAYARAVAYDGADRALLLWSVSGDNVCTHRLATRPPGAVGYDRPAPPALGGKYECEAGLADLGPGGTFGWGGPRYATAAPGAPFGEPAAFPGAAPVMGSGDGSGSAAFATSAGEILLYGDAPPSPGSGPAPEATTGPGTSPAPPAASPRPVPRLHRTRVTPRRVRARTLRRLGGVKVRFRLSAPAPVSIVLERASTSRRVARVRTRELRAGRRAVRLPLERLRPGRYRLTVTAGPSTRRLQLFVRR